MLYRNFSTLLDKLEACHKVLEEYEPYLNLDIFKCHVETITILLYEIYTEVGVTILDNWFAGNREPITFTSNSGVVKTLNIRSKRELWSTLELIRHK